MLSLHDGEDPDDDPDDDQDREQGLLADLPFLARYPVLKPHPYFFIDIDFEDDDEGPAAMLMRLAT